MIRRITDPIDVQQAAAILGVTAARVRQLCKAGQVKAEHFNGVWMISKASVKHRQANPPNPWRPTTRR